VPNPQIAQGSLNRLVTSLTWESAPELNVTASFLSREMIRFARNGNAVTFIPTGTGAVTSGEPFMMITLTIGLLKTQSLAAAYEARLLANARIGNGTVRPDVSEGIGAFDLTNCAIENVGELTFDGSNPIYPVMLSGYMPVNNDLWP
jgi:hypothetical protein